MAPSCPSLSSPCRASLWLRLRLWRIVMGSSFSIATWMESGVNPANRNLGWSGAASGSMWIRTWLGSINILQDLGHKEQLIDADRLFFFNSAFNFELHPWTCVFLPQNTGAETTSQGTRPHREWHSRPRRSTSAPWGAARAMLHPSWQVLTLPFFMGSLCIHDYTILYMDINGNMLDLLYLC